MRASADERSRAQHSYSCADAHTHTHMYTGGGAGVKIPPCTRRPPRARPTAASIGPRECPREPPIRRSDLMPSASSTAVAEATTTEVQSLALIRNLLRLNVSQVLYARGCLPEADFETREVEGMRVQSLGGESASVAAQTIVAWLEQGVFAAISKRVLEKAVLCISEDEAGECVLEAWVLSIAWAMDEQGIERPTVHFGQDKRPGAALSIEPQAKYTKARVRQMSSTMLRQISLMLCTLPALPSLHWVSMRLIYRDQVTPADYEPSGFESAARGADEGEDGARLCFLSKPMQLTVAQPVATGHHTYTMHVVSSFLDDDAFAPSGLKRKAASGPREQPRWQLDLGSSVAGELGAHADELDEPTMAEYVERARRLAEAEEEGTPFSSAALAHALGCSRAAAERVLDVLERERLLTEFQPRESARLVQRAGRAKGGAHRGGSDDGSHSQSSDGDLAAAGASQSDGSASPQLRRSASAAATTTPATLEVEATGAPTPGRALAKKQRREEEKAAPPVRETGRKVSATMRTVPSQPPAPKPKAPKAARAPAGRK